MKIGTIATTNQKGQIVIPQKFRKALGIQANSPLNLLQVGEGIFIYPVEEVLTKVEKESSYWEILKMTKGAWGKENWPLLRKKRKKIEIKGSSARKKRW